MDIHNLGYVPRTAIQRIFMPIWDWWLTYEITLQGVKNVRDIYIYTYLPKYIPRLLHLLTLNNQALYCICSPY